MQRDDFIAALGEKDPWDIVIIGGGATGLGCAVDAASRGYRTLLCEQLDFAQGTSSRSTKLVHGGVRYLRQGNLRLVRHALQERERLLRNARHLVWPRAFIVPAYAWGERAWYGLGLKLYDQLAGSLGMGRSRTLSAAATLEAIPTLQRRGLRGGIRYFDGQFDDARLAVCLARTAVAHGDVVLNYVAVKGFWKEQDRVRGIDIEDRETGQRHRVFTRAVISAAGIFADEVQNLDTPGAPARLAFSQGAHMVLDKSFVPQHSALMVPKTSDGRVLFAIPWHDRVVLGTTDQRVPRADIEPVPRAEELAFLCDNAARYLNRAPSPRDALSIFAGIRPLVLRSENRTDTSELPRDHLVSVSASGLISITGGKWTTYRQMAEEAVDHAVQVGDLAPRPCITHDLPLQGSPAEAQSSGLSADDDPMHYGAEHEAAQSLAANSADAMRPIHPRLPYQQRDVLWAVRHEWARTLEDVLARRTRALLLDARAAMEGAHDVAHLLRQELGKDVAWAEHQVQQFQSLARNYLPESAA